MFKRLTLLLTISNGVFTKTRSFRSEHIYSTTHIEYSNYDEIIIVCTDPSPNSSYYEFIDNLVKELSIPLVLSGNVTNLDEAKHLFNLGADRIILNRVIWHNPSIIKEVAEIYGKQAVLVSLDFISSKSKICSFDWENQIQRDRLFPENFTEYLPYIGEILIQDKELDGRVIGANIESISNICSLLPPSLPIHVGSCGLVSWAQYADLLSIDSIDAVSVTNVHHMSLKATTALRNFSIKNKINLRTP